MTTGGDPSADFSLIRKVFDDLVERSAPAREAALRASGLSDALRREVRSLLDAADAAGGFLEQPTGSLPQEVVPLDLLYSSLRPGAMVGAFRVERLVGRGGHGEVYLARRADGAFEQTVALKLLRPEAIALHDRFRQERQILAGLEHPGIARLIDGGEAPDGRPYLALEFVEGEPITFFCRRRNMPTERRLALFQQVCEAVAYAHRHLVVHRDIKPGNILVSVDGQPKLLDFGVARLLEDGGDPEHTVAAVTPQYAAPEQLEGRPPTTAADVYALGAVLFELLADAPVWPTAGPLTALQRMTGEEPRLVSEALGRKERGVVTVREVRGDLDAIVGKAMRNDLEQRYDGVASLNADIDRHRAHLPVLARNGRWSYRARRFARRRRGALSAAASVLLVAFLGAASYRDQAWRTQVARESARIEAARASAVRDYVMLSLRAAAQWTVGGVADTKQALDRTAAALARETEAAAAPTPTQTTLLLTMADLQMEIGDLRAAEALLVNAAAAARRRDDRIGAAEADQALAAVAVGSGDLDRAERLLAQARGVWADDPERHTRHIAEAAGVEAALLRGRGRRGDAIETLRDAASRLPRDFGPGDEEVARLRNNLSLHLIESDRVEEAARVLDEVWRGLVAEGRTLSATAFSVQDHLAAVALRRGETAQAERLWREAIERQRAAYGPSMSLATTELNLARLRLARGAPEEALTLIERAAPTIVGFAGARSVPAVMLRQSRALALAALGRLPEARAEIVAALEDADAGYGAQSAYFGLALLARAQISALADDTVSARADIAQARNVLTAAGPAGTPHLQALEAFEQDLVTRPAPRRD